MALIGEWLQLHGCKAETVSDCVEIIETGRLFLDIVGVEVVERLGPRLGYTSRDEALEAAIYPSMSAALGLDNDGLGEIVRSIHFADAIAEEEPHTIDHGGGQPIEVCMSWGNSVADLMCLAHEVAHAFQLRLSEGSFMPPVARETCAFLGELALINWAAKNDPNLAAHLLLVWRKENQRYVGEDCVLLRSALADPNCAYTYRMNYPLARAAAIIMRRSGADAKGLFKAGSKAIAMLPLDEIADLAGQTHNYLPDLPPPETDQPAIDAYRALGAMALLDIDFWKGDSEGRIEDYYATLRHHLQTSTAFVALDEVRRPVGYATWRKAEGDNTVTLMRQAAPFGDHLLLQKALERHLGQESDVHAQHPRSARQEQMAW